MDTNLLKKHINNFVSKTKKNPTRFTEEFKERLDHITYFQSYRRQEILQMSEEDI